MKKDTRERICGRKYFHVHCGPGGNGKPCSIKKRFTDAQRLNKMLKMGVSVLIHGDNADEDRWTHGLKSRREIDASIRMSK